MQSPKKLIINFSPKKCHRYSSIPLTSANFDKETAVVKEVFGEKLEQIFSGSPPNSGYKNEIENIVNELAISPELFLKLIIACMTKTVRTNLEKKIITSYLFFMQDFVKLMRAKAISGKEIYVYKDLLNLSESIFYEKQLKNSVLMRFGEKGNTAYIILSGQVDVLIKSSVVQNVREINYFYYLANLIKYHEFGLLNQVINDNFRNYPVEIIDDISELLLKGKKNNNLINNDKKKFFNESHKRLSSLNIKLNPSNEEIKEIKKVYQISATELLKKFRLRLMNPRSDKNLNKCSTEEYIRRINFPYYKIDKSKFKTIRNDKNIPETNKETKKKNIIKNENENTTPKKIKLDTKIKNKIEEKDEEEEDEKDEKTEKDEKDEKDEKNEKKEKKEKNQKKNNSTLSNKSDSKSENSSININPSSSSSEEPSFHEYDESIVSNLKIYSYIKVATLGKGSLFGEMALSEQNSLRSGTIIASADCHFSLLNKKIFNNCIKIGAQKHLRELLSYFIELPLFNGIPEMVFYRKYYTNLSKLTIYKGSNIVNQGEKPENITLIKTGAFGLTTRISLYDLTRLILHYIKEINLNKYCDKKESQILKRKVLNIINVEESKLNDNFIFKKFYTEEQLLRITEISCPEVFINTDYLDEKGNFAFSIEAKEPENVIYKMSNKFYTDLLSRNFSVRENHEKLLHKKLSIMIHRLLITRNSLINSFLDHKGKEEIGSVVIKELDAILLLQLQQKRKINLIREEKVCLGKLIKKKSGVFSYKDFKLDNISKKFLLSNHNDLYGNELYDNLVFYNNNNYKGKQKIIQGDKFLSQHANSKLVPFKLIRDDSIINKKEKQKIINSLKILKYNRNNKLKFNNGFKSENNNKKICAIKNFSFNNKVNNKPKIQKNPIKNKETNYEVYKNLRTMNKLIFKNIDDEDLYLPLFNSEINNRNLLTNENNNEYNKIKIFFISYDFKPKKIIINNMIWEKIKSTFKETNKQLSEINNKQSDFSSDDENQEHNNTFRSPTNIHIKFTNHFLEEKYNPFKTFSNDKKNNTTITMSSNYSPKNQKKEKFPRIFKKFKIPTFHRKNLSNFKDFKNINFRTTNSNSNEGSKMLYTDMSKVSNFSSRLRKFYSPQEINLIRFRDKIYGNMDADKYNKNKMEKYNSDRNKYYKRNISKRIKTFYGKSGMSLFKIKKHRNLK